MADVDYQIGLISFWASFQEYYKNWIHDVSVITRRAMALPPYLYTLILFLYKRICALWFLVHSFSKYLLEAHYVAVSVPDSAD